MRPDLAASTPSWVTELSTSHCAFTVDDLQVGAVASTPVATARSFVTMNALGRVAVWPPEDTTTFQAPIAVVDC